MERTISVAVRKLLSGECGIVLLELVDWAMEWASAVDQVKSI